MADEWTQPGGIGKDVSYKGQGFKPGSNYV